MIQIARALRRFHLIDAEADEHGTHEVLRVPEGLSYLVTGPAAGGPRIVPESAAASAGSSFPKGTCSVILEPIARQGELVLLMVLSSAQPPVVINGVTAGRVATLRQGDVIQLDDGRHAFHVAMHLHSVIGRAPKDRADDLCLTCHRTLDRDIVLICSVCGHAQHCDTSGDAKARNCILSDTCPSCKTTLHTDGHTAVPEDL